MTDQKTLSDDIAFLRALAEAGRDGPVNGGSILVASGLLFGTASAVIWAAAVAGVAVPGIQFVWAIALVLFLAYLAYQKRGARPASEASRLQGLAWSGLGWAMGTVVVSLLLMAVRTNIWQIAAAISPVILSLYGAAWVGAAGLSRVRWLNLVGAGSFLAALLNAWLAAEGTAYLLVYAVSLYLLVALPGLILMRRARAAA